MTPEEALKAIDREVDALRRRGKSGRADRLAEAAAVLMAGGSLPVTRAVHRGVQWLVDEAETRVRDLLDSKDDA